MTALIEPVIDPSRSVPPATDAATVLATAEQAAARVAPLWPLESLVAVNPFHGLADQPFETAALTLAEAAAARLTMPRAFYREAIAAGRITEADLTAALAEAQVEGLPEDAESLLALADDTETLPPPLPTVADLASTLTGRNWAAFVTERVAGFAADWFDTGQAAWRCPGQDQPLYSAWRETALVDRQPDVAGLAGFRLALRDLPKTSEALLALAPHRLGLPPAALERYFHRLLMTVGGWAAFARHKAWRASLAGGSDPAPVDLLAIRLAWELAILQALRPAGIESAWAEAIRRSFVPGNRAGLAIDCVLQAAYDKAWQRRLDASFAARPPIAPTGPKAVQAAFCIDVRSEVLRRALEDVAPEIETIGFAGFFGLAIEHVPFGHAQGRAHCPVLLPPAWRIEETIQGVSPGAVAEIRERRLGRERLARAWRFFRGAAVSSFAFVETLGLAYLARLVGDAFGFARVVPRSPEAGLPAAASGRLGPALADGALDPSAGIPEAERAGLAAAILQGMSLTGGFARLVMLTGHQGSTVNNPQARGLDCGACGGQSGEVNARLAAILLNDPAVRLGLKARGIAVPGTTVFIAAIHDTTTDEVRLLDRKTVPVSHQPDLVALESRLAAASERSRAERAIKLGLAADRPIAAQLEARAASWAETRPEWGLAGCAAFIAAPRHRTAGLALDGRSFLHSYDWRMDPGFATLELIMTAPMVVAAWINLQYFGSTVDNRVFGSGNKVLHNVVGKLGVLEGNGGDLRTGLAWQSLHDGERLVHEPLRLTVVIEAPLDAIGAVIGRHESVRHLVENGWLHLFAMDQHGRLGARCRRDGVWEKIEPEAPGHDAARDAAGREMATTRHGMDRHDQLPDVRNLSVSSQPAGLASSGG